MPAPPDEIHWVLGGTSLAKPNQLHQAKEKWEEQDSNLRSLRQQIYSLSRLTASVPSRGCFFKRPRSFILVAFRFPLIRCGF